ncbi:MAG: glycoside hydrolase family 38 C-terminal domain-containing protein [Janthinobacterium lividum]
MTTKVHLIFNAHLDPVWLWPWQAGMDEALATCRSACDRMDTHPDLVFTRGEAWIYWQVERTDPELFERIRQHVKTGRWQIVNGWWIQPDCNAPSEWGFERQIEMGRDYFMDRFGIFPRIGYNVDSFGHSAALPSLLRRYGQDRYVMMRPEDHETVLPTLFHWRGTPDEEPVTVYRINSGYAPQELSEAHILRSTQGLPPGLGHAACFVGVGDHGGGPTESLIAWYRENKDSIPGCTLLLSSLSDFFDEVDAYQGTLPTVTGELQQHAVGCYSVYRPIHVAVRRAEHLLRQAECLRDAHPQALESPEKTQADLKDAWQQVCFAHFHDILGGSSIPSAYPIILNQVGLALAKADDLLQIGLRRLYRVIPEAPQQRLVMLNASDHPYEGYAEFEPWLEFSGWKAGWGLVDSQGRSVPLQLMNPEETAYSHGKADPTTLKHPRLLFPVSLAANELSTFRLMETAPPAVPAASAQSIGTRLISGAAAWDAGQISLPGGLTIAPTLELIKDPTDTWSHPLVYPGAYPGYPQEAAAQAAWDGQKEAPDSGPLMASVIQEGQIGSSRLTAEWRVYAGQPFVELLLRVLWQERYKVLKLCVDFPGAAEQRLDGIPGRSLARPNDAREMPLRDWTLVQTAQGPLGIAAPDIFALDGTPSRLRLTLLRSPLMANSDPFTSNEERKTLEAYRKTYSDDGVHDFRFRFFGGAAATAQRLDLETTAMQRPLIFGDLTKGMPTRPIITK